MRNFCFYFSCNTMQLIPGSIKIELKRNKTKKQVMMNVQEISQGKKIDVQEMIEFYDQLDQLDCPCM